MAIGSAVSCLEHSGPVVEWRSYKSLDRYRTMYEINHSAYRPRSRCYWRRREPGNGQRTTANSPEKNMCSAHSKSRPRNRHINVTITENDQKRTNPKICPAPALQTKYKHSHSKKHDNLPIKPITHVICICYTYQVIDQ